MARWLDRLIPPSQPRKSAGLPSLDVRSILPQTLLSQGKKQSNLPNASLIYGVAAAALLAVGFYTLFVGSWVTGILIMLPAACLLGFSLYFLRFSG